ncbi:large ribosomal subunit protein mL38-like [Tubulanus polymorphus]|uniref:large ribosomal subunit protein mL38-like n=1 Tax=Tubulanus polymorphus TaxID=672921 RepID=UPI003DA23BD8
MAAPMAFADRLFKAKTCLYSLRFYPVRQLRTFQKTIQPIPTATESFEQKQAAMNAKDAELDEIVDIGLPWKGAPVSSKERQISLKKLKSDVELEQLARNKELFLPLDEVEQDWLREVGPLHIQTVAEHYGIFNDLYGAANFIPQVPLSVMFDYDDSLVSPVFIGNRIPAQEAVSAPYISYDAADNSLWTLVMTCPDEHLQHQDKEYIHWFIGNIPGSDVSKGEVICDYLQPIPARGTGFHRYVFVLYKQEKKIDFSKEKRPQDCVSLKERTFSTLDFYREHQDHMTPASLAFFLSEWDHSVQDTFRHQLGMRDPVFEYCYPIEYHPPQRYYPKKEPFNKYLDYYRDHKEIAEEILKKRLKMISPFEDYPKRLKYPNIFHVPNHVPTWKKDELAKERLRLGKYKDLP